jgi:hypothetical protein
LQKGNFWVGGTDDLIEGEWIWTDTDAGFDYTDWVHGQPDNKANYTTQRTKTMSNMDPTNYQG